MKKKIAKQLRKRARELWDEAVEEFPHLAESNGTCRNINVIEHTKAGRVLFTTSTHVKLGYKRVLKNLKWQWSHGHRTSSDEKLALDNAIKWSNAK